MNMKSTILTYCWERVTFVFRNIKFDALMNNQQRSKSAIERTASWIQVYNHLKLLNIGSQITTHSTEGHKYFSDMFKVYGNKMCSRRMNSLLLQREVDVITPWWHHWIASTCTFLYCDIMTELRYYDCTDSVEHR